jgi:hypothetical protein
LKEALELSAGSILSLNSRFEDFEDADKVSYMASKAFQKDYESRYNTYLNRM